MKINGTEYIEPKLTFTNTRKMEAWGVSVTDMSDKPLSCVSAYLALAMGASDLTKSDAEIDAHFDAGGTLDPLMDAFKKAVDESNFFKAAKDKSEKDKAAT